MIIVKLTGGLGNQMFQYAAGRNLALKYNCSLYLDKTIYQTYTVHNFELDKFNIIENYQSSYKLFVNKALRRLNINKKLSVIAEPTFHYNESIFKTTPPLIIDGYWQSEKYFSDIRSQLINDFSLKTTPSTENKDWLQLIENTESVSLHIRRGDYLTNPNANAFHGVLPLTYYGNSVARLQKIEKNLTYFVFSDDPEWVSQNLILNGPTHFISNNQKTGYEDLRLMQHCKHNIIANSSFSWWAAWLNKNIHKKVYAPNRWFKDTSIVTADLLPDPWETVPLGE